jgi:HK97 family phage major capsid protein
MRQQIPIDEDGAEPRRHLADILAGEATATAEWNLAHRNLIRSRSNARRPGYVPDASASEAEDDRAALRLMDLHRRRGSLSADETAELAALADWYDELGHMRYTRMEDPSGMNQLRALAERALSGAPGQGESVGGRAGFGQGDLQAQPTDRGGWASTPGADQYLAPHRRAAMQMIERYSRSNVLDAADADRLDAILRGADPDALTARYLAAVGNEHYGTAFGRMLADPQFAHLRFSQAEVEAVREADWAMRASDRAAMTTGSAGFPLPLTLDPSIIKTGAGALNPLRSLATVTTVGTHDWQGVSSDGVTAAYVQEGVEATDVTPVLAAPKVSTQQGRAFVQFTIEAGQDWAGGGVQQELIGLVRDARDVCDATAWLTGTGSNAPFGLFGGDATYSLGTSQRVQTAGSGAFAVGDPWLLKAGIPARFLPASTFMANPATFDKIFRFTGGNSAEPPIMATRDGSVMGQPKAELSTMATGVTTGTKLIIGGDFKTGYRVIDRLGLQAELIPHMLGSTRLPNGTRGLYCYWRSGAAVVAKGALRYMEVL